MQAESNEITHDELRNAFMDGILSYAEYSRMSLFHHGISAFVIDNPPIGQDYYV